MRKVLTGVSAGVIAVALAACGGATTPEPTGAPPTGSAQSSPSTPATDSPETTTASAEDVVVTREYFGAEVEVTVHPVEVREGVAALTIEYDVPDDAEDVTSIAIATSGAEQAPPAGATGVRIVDGDRVLPVAAAGDDRAAKASPYGTDPGDTVTSMSMHAAPQAESVGVLIPLFGYVADVPVVDADARFDKVVEEVGEPTDTAALDLRTFFVTDEDTSASAEAQTVTVAVRSDVLFASSEFVLSAQADAALQDAAAQVTASAPGGTVTVVGHTDDVGSDASNQTLSEQRAASVADRLGALLGDGYTISAEGRGESEPVAVGRSDEARQANRRVELTFEGELPVTPETTGELASTDAPTASGLDAVTYTGPQDDVEFTAQVVEMARTDAGIVGTLRLTVEPGDDYPFGALGDTDTGHAAGRGFNLANRIFGTHEMALLTADKRVLPFDYEVPGGGVLVSGRRLLGDEALAFRVATGAGILATAIWPDTGQDAVTIDVPGSFRITDVPVTAGD